MPGTCIVNLSEPRAPPSRCLGFQIISTPPPPVTCDCNRPQCGMRREFTDASRRYEMSKRCPIKSTPAPTIGPIETCGCNRATCGIRREIPNTQEVNKRSEIKSTPVALGPIETCGCGYATCGIRREIPVPEEVNKRSQIKPKPVVIHGPAECGCNNTAQDEDECYTADEMINAVQSTSSEKCSAQVSFLMPSSGIHRRKLHQVLSASGRTKWSTERRVQTTLPIGFRSCECNLPVQESIEMVEEPARPKVINVKLHLKLMPEQPNVPMRKALEKRSGGPCGWDCSRFGPMFEQMLGVLKDIDKGVHDLKNNQTSFFKACKSKPVNAGTDTESPKKKSKKNKEKKDKEKAKPKKSKSSFKDKWKSKKNKKDKKKKGKSKDSDEDQGDSSDEHSKTESSQESDEEDKSEHKKKEKKPKKSKNKKKDSKKSKSEDNGDSAESQAQKRQAAGSDTCFKDHGKTVRLKIPNNKKNERRKKCDLWRKMSRTFSGDCFSGLKRDQCNRNTDTDDQNRACCSTTRKDNTTQYSKQPIYSSVGGIGLQTDFVRDKSNRHFMTSTTALGLDSKVPSVLIRTHNLEEDKPSMNDLDSKIPLHGSIVAPNESEESEYQSLESNASSLATPPVFSSVITANETRTSPPAPNSSPADIEEIDKKEHKNEKEKNNKDSKKRKTKKSKSETRLSAGYESPSLPKPSSKIIALTDVQNTNMKISETCETTVNINNLPSKSHLDSNSPRKLISKSRDGPSIGTEILATILEHVESPDADSSKIRHKVEIISPANAIEEIFARRRSETEALALNKASALDAHCTESSTSNEATPPSSAHLVTYSKSRRRIWASALLQDLRSGSEEVLKSDSDRLKTPVASVIKIEPSVEKNEEDKKKE